MLSFDKDIYKKIMRPAGAIYFVNSEKLHELKKYTPRNQPEYYAFLYPRGIEDEITIKNIQVR